MTCNFFSIIANTQISFVVQIIINLLLTKLMRTGCDFWLERKKEYSINLWLTALCANNNITRLGIDIASTLVIKLTRAGT